MKRSLPFLVALWSVSALPVAHGARVDAIAIPVGKASQGVLSRQAKRIQASAFGREATAVFSDSEARALSGLGDAGLGLAYRLEFATEARLEAFKAWAGKNARAYRIEANPKARLTEDPLRFLQWGLSNRGGTYSVDIDDFTSRQLPAATGEDVALTGAPDSARPVIVAVLDTGIDVTHPDLKAAIVRNDAECEALVQYRSCIAKAKPGEAAKCDPLFLKDHDGNGYPLDCNGWNLAAENDGRSGGKPKPLPITAGILGNGNVADYAGHGTHVAGIVAAQVNGVGVEGVAPRARILPVRVISGEPSEKIRAQEVGVDLPAPVESDLHAGYGLGDVVARGVLYSIRSGAQVINLSLGWPDPLDSQLVRRILALARSRGILVVAAAGNDSTDSVIFPCRYDGVVCAGAHTPDGSLAFFSNYGYGVDVLAPGWNILSTYPMDLMPFRFTDQVGYEAKDGTSMAAPFVSGLLARMLGSGFAADEAYSRLILGARPTRPSQVEDPKRFARSSISGNADLAAAFAVSAQALILPSRKSMIRVEWDRVSARVPMTFVLQNHWVDAQDATVTFEPVEAGWVAPVQSSWKIGQWKALEEKSFATEIEILNPRLSSEIDFRVRVSAANAQPREFIVRVDVISPVSRDASASSELKIRLLLDEDGRALARIYDEVRTVAIDHGPGREYLGVRKGPPKILELLVESERGVTLRGALTLEPNGNTIKSLRRIRRDSLPGTPSYVLIETLPAERSKLGASQMTWLDSALKPMPGRAPQKVDPVTTYLSEDFQWQVREGELVPTWYALGRIPPLEQKPYDPWDPRANTDADFRMYMLAHDGLHSVKLPEEFPQMVSLLPQTPEQRDAGVVSVVISKGEDYALQYATAELAGGQWRNVKAIELPVYHYIRGIVAAPVHSLDPRVPYVGTAFSGYVNPNAMTDGSRRTTLIGPSGISDLVTRPTRNFDVITDVTGTFVGGGRQSQFALTKYEIEYHDGTGSASTSQRRFSFLPDIFSMKSFFPILIEDTELARATGERRTPGLFIPGDFIFSKATQLIVPRFDEAGRLKGITRPAKFHLDSRPGCTALPTAKPADAFGPAELAFFCGDRFLSIPLSY